MENLNSVPLFSSFFIIGCSECERTNTKTNTIEIETLHKWIDWKDGNLTLKRKYNSNKTEYVSFLQIIDLNLFKQLLIELNKIYKKEYPYSNKEDFINHIFRMTIEDLKWFIERDYRLLPTPTNVDQYRFYTYFDKGNEQFVDFVVSKDLTIEHYKQYYKKVLEFLNEFDFENQNNSADKAETKNTIKIKPEIHETELSEKIKKHFNFLLGNCPRKGKPILSNENDFNNLINWTKHFFENDFEVPEITNPIKTVNTNFYITQLAFQILFNELRKANFHSQRTTAKTLFNLWENSFLDYKGYKESNFWKVKKKKELGIDYDTEVKKLMLID